jgi:hypothetical protein
MLSLLCVHTMRLQERVRSLVEQLYAVCMQEQCCWCYCWLAGSQLLTAADCCLKKALLLPAAVVLRLQLHVLQPVTSVRTHQLCQLVMAIKEDALTCRCLCRPGMAMPRVALQAQVCNETS